MQRKARDILIYLSMKYEGDYFAILSAIRKKEMINEDLYHNYQHVDKSVDILTIIDDDYPEVFRQIANPPIVLYLKGNKSLINNVRKNIAVIGTRNPSSYGKEVTKEIVSELVKEEFTVVSGLAKGIDGIAHLAALDEGGKTIAVLGSGINYPYPSSNKSLYDRISREGLLISEYPNLTKPQPEFFKFRNRIVAALSRGVLITEAKYRSGTLITVGYALEKGNDIYCIPERAGNDSGCNKLIKDGAYLVENHRDIIRLWTN